MAVVCLMVLLCFGVVSSLPFDNCLMSLCHGVNFFFVPNGLLNRVTRSCYAIALLKNVALYGARQYH